MPHHDYLFSVWDREKTGITTWESAPAVTLPSARSHPFSTNEYASLIVLIVTNDEIWTELIENGYRMERAEVDLGSSRPDFWVDKVEKLQRRRYADFLNITWSYSWSVLFRAFPVP